MAPWCPGVFRAATGSRRDLSEPPWCQWEVGMGPRLIPQHPLPKTPVECPPTFDFLLMARVTLVPLIHRILFLHTFCTVLACSLHASSTFLARSLHAHHMHPPHSLHRSCTILARSFHAASTLPASSLHHSCTVLPHFFSRSYLPLRGAATLLSRAFHTPCSRAGGFARAPHQPTPRPCQVAVTV